MELRRLAFVTLATVCLAGACATDESTDAPAWRVDAIVELPDGERIDVTIHDEPYSIAVSERGNATIAILGNVEGEAIVQAYARKDEVGLIDENGPLPTSGDEGRSDPYVGVTIAAASGELETDGARLFGAAQLPGGGGWGAIGGTVGSAEDDLDAQYCRNQCGVKRMFCELGNELAGPDDTLDPFCDYRYLSCIEKC